MVCMDSLLLNFTVISEKSVEYVYQQSKKNIPQSLAYKILILWRVWSDRGHFKHGLMSQKVL